MSKKCASICICCVSIHVHWFMFWKILEVHDMTQQNMFPNIQDSLLCSWTCVVGRVITETVSNQQLMQVFECVHKRFPGTRSFRPEDGRNPWILSKGPTAIYCDWRQKRIENHILVNRLKEESSKSKKKHLVMLGTDCDYTIRKDIRIPDLKVFHRSVWFCTFAWCGKSWRPETPHLGDVGIAICRYTCCPVHWQTACWPSLPKRIPPFGSRAWMSGSIGISYHIGTRSTSIRSTTPRGCSGQGA